MRPTLVIPCLVVLAGACKPADEQPRHAARPEMTLPRGPDIGPPPEGIMSRTAPPATPPPIDGEVRSAVSERTGLVDVPDTMPSPPDAEAPAPAPGEAIAEVAPDVAETLAPEPPELPVEDARWAALLADLDRAPSAEQQERARTLNKSGLEKHRKSKWKEAIADYEGALAAWPSHPFSRYNLACALALQKRPDEALFMLRALGHVATSDPSAADRLRAARVDGDFAALRADPRFRELTGATDVLVAWSREEERANAKRHVETLRNARWLARVAPRAWNAIDTLPLRPTVLHRSDDAVAARVVGDIVRALEATVPGIVSEIAGPLPPEAPPIVVWLPPPAPPEPIEPPPTDPIPPVEPPTAPPPDTRSEAPRPPAESLTAIKDFIGHRLVPDGPGSESLELKPTGFFVWEIGPTRAGDAKTTRTGRYQLRGPSLSLTFKETLETPTGEGSPRIEVHEGRTLTLFLTIPEPGTLAIEARPFHVR